MTRGRREANLAARTQSSPAGSAGVPAIHRAEWCKHIRGKRPLESGSFALVEVGGM